MKIRRRMICNCGELKEAINSYIERADKDLEKQLKDAGFVNPKKTVKDMSELEDELTEVLEEDSKFIINNINSYNSLPDYADVGFPQTTGDQQVIEKLTRTFEGKLGQYVPDYLTEYIKITDRDLKRDLMSQRTTAWIGNWSGELANLMKLSDNREIERILQNGLKDGWSISQFSDAIAGSGIRDAGYRARRVSITEVLRAHSVAQQESFMQSPSVVGKLWRHSGTWLIEPRINHQEMDNGKAVAKDEPFTLYGADGAIYYPMYPRDSVLPPGESINCHCVDEPVVDEEILGLPLEERQRLQQEAIDAMDEEWLKELDEQNRLRLLGA